MPRSVQLSIPHDLGVAEARRRIAQGLERLTAQIGAMGELEQGWEGDTLRFSLAAIGQTVTGSIAVHAREVRIEVLLPGLFAMIAGKVKDRLRNEGQRLLGGPEAGEKPGLR